MAKRGILARLLGLPDGPLLPKPAKSPAASVSAGTTPKPRPMTSDRKALIDEAMRVQRKMREELGEEEIEKMAKAIMGEKKP